MGQMEPLQSDSIAAHLGVSLLSPTGWGILETLVRIPAKPTLSPLVGMDDFTSP